MTLTFSAQAVQRPPFQPLSPAIATPAVVHPDLPAHQQPAQRLAASQVAWAADLLATAYATDPLWQRLLTTPQRAWLCQVLVRYALHQGRAYTNPDRTAVALWRPPGAEAPSAACLFRSGALLGPWHLPIATIRQLVELRRAQQARRHRHLGERTTGAFELLALAVHPAARGTDTGRSLLMATIAAMQVGNAPCYCETTNLRALPLALRLGFRIVGEANDPLAGTPQWALARGV